MDWKQLLASITRSVDEELRLRNAYLVTENRILRQQMTGRVPKLPSNREMMRNLVGGQPEEVPELYDLASPVSRVSPTCPPILLFQGEHDFIVPSEAARASRVSHST